MGISVTSGDYEPRSPDVARQREVKAGQIALGTHKGNLVNVQQKQLVKVAAGIGATAGVISYRRAFLNNEIVMGTTYTKSAKRTNSVVAYARGGRRFYVQVHSFHLVTQGNPQRFITLVRRLEEVPGRFVEPSHGITLNHLNFFNTSFAQVHPPG